MERGHDTTSAQVGEPDEDLADTQAATGRGRTRLASTERGRLVRILKIDNKGRHNRRVRSGWYPIGPIDSP
jgi:hypothetical protein